MEFCPLHKKSYSIYNILTCLCNATCNRRSEQCNCEAAFNKNFISKSILSFIRIHIVILRCIHKINVAIVNFRAREFIFNFKTFVSNYGLESFKCVDIIFLNDTRIQ